MNPKATLVTDDPIIAPIAEMEFNTIGIQQMVAWIKDRRPECIPEEVHNSPNAAVSALISALFPHDDYLSKKRSHNELLVELAGRKCYDSFGEKAGRRTNREYIENTQKGEIPHASIMYHAKMTFFIAGISRRVSHELIRHYVGADRDEEGSPSQESTRYVEHNGRYIVHPRLLQELEQENEEGVLSLDFDGKRILPRSIKLFKHAMDQNRAAYLDYINAEFQKHPENKPKGMARKRIFESASSFLSHSAETSFIWTTNPIALAKLLRERDNEGADLEFQRLARVWKQVALAKWPNLFVQPWMQE